MEATKQTFENERSNDVYVVSKETTMDLVKIEPADEDDNEDVGVEDDNTYYNQTAAFTATTQYTRYYDGGVSSTTEFGPGVPILATERPDTEFQLMFVGESGD